MIINQTAASLVDEKRNNFSSCHWLTFALPKLFFSQLCLTWKHYQNENSRQQLRQRELYTYHILYIVRVHLLSTKFWRNCQHPNVPKYEGGCLGTWVMWGLSCESKQSFNTTQRCLWILWMKALKLFPEL